MFAFGGAELLESSLQPILLQSRETPLKCIALRGYLTGDSVDRVGADVFQMGT
jgi:hypothetical protein